MEQVGLVVGGAHVYGEWHPARGKAAVVMIHGFNSCLREYGDLPARIAAGGVGALAIDMRGHGLSRGEAGRVDLDRALQDVDAAVAWLRAEGKKRLGLVGHSLGASLALGIVSRREHFDALVVAHPLRRLMDEVPAWQKPVYHIIGRYARRRMAKGQAAGHFPRDPRYRLGYVDPAAARAAKNEAYMAEKVSLGNYTFATTMDAAAWAAHVKVPTLCVHSAADQVVRPASSLEVFDALAGPAEHLVHGGGHSCFRDLDGKRVADGISEFLSRRLGGA